MFFLAWCVLYFIEESGVHCLDTAHKTMKEIVKQIQSGIPFDSLDLLLKEAVYQREMGILAPLIEKRSSRIQCRNWNPHPSKNDSNVREMPCQSSPRVRCLSDLEFPSEAIEGFS